MRRLLVALLVGGVLSGCAPKAPPLAPGAPRFPEFVFPTPTAGVPSSEASKQRNAWNTLQAGNIGSAERQFNQLLRRAPGNASVVAGLGYVALAKRELSQAIARFDHAIGLQPSLAPALVGKGLALVELGRAGDAISNFEAAQKSDPALDLSGRIEALRFRAVDDSVSQARAAVAAGKLNEARDAYGQALAASPDSALLLRELAIVEQKAGQSAEARQHLERALSVDPHDRLTQIALAELFESEGDLDAAVRAYQAAQATESTPDIETRLAVVRERADLAKLPGEFRAIPTLGSVTRGDLAALVGVRLSALLRSAPLRPAALVTDARRHWAASWIAAVLRAGVMEPFPNHTFQPEAVVRRVDLAAAISRVLDLIIAREPSREERWSGTPSPLVDLPESHPAYRDVSRAIAARVFDVPPNRAFDPTRVVSGVEAEDAVSRLERLSGVNPRGNAR
jgi:tetratricopeptide (TPR) repeat protein